ncbi:MAG: hypothetical protein M3490_01120 [Chloroflexota bacterium]|nr:hypothetical protein [Chloroflexota bacterium]
MPRWLIMVAVTMAASSSQVATAQDTTPEPPGDSEVTTQLPAADLPNMNEQGYLFELESSWTGSFDSVPREAPVYQLNVPVHDLTSVEQMASRLGIDGEVEDQGSGTFQVEGESGTLFITGGLEQYTSAAEIPEGDLPEDDQAVAFAREWLRQTQLLPADAGEGSVIARVEEPARIIVSIEPLRPENLLSQYPSITVIMGPDALVLEASFRWSTLSTTDTYSLRPVDTAWTEVAEKRSYLQVDVPEGVAEPGTTIAGQSVYDSVSIGYTTSGIPGETQFLQPVYVFSGSVTPEGSDTSFPITAYVPALVNSQQPVG